MSKIGMEKQGELEIKITCENQEIRDRILKNLIKGKKFMEKLI